MLATSDLDQIARARLEDAEALLRSKRYDGAVYLCGYAIELALKARICKTLGWPGYPETTSEFKNYRSFKVHSLDVLLHLSGLEQTVKENYFADWSDVVNWDPEARYKPIGGTSEAEARNMIEAANRLLDVL